MGNGKGSTILRKGNASLRMSFRVFPRVYNRYSRVELGLFRAVMKTVKDSSK